MIDRREEPPLHQAHFVFELTQRCNHDCQHCYNAWKNPVGYPVGELDTAETLHILARMLDGTGATLVSLTGGEPLLRPDLDDIVALLGSRGVAVNLITNGTLLTDAAIARLTPDRVSIFELPLLSSEREIHDRMSGSAGAFDKVTAAMAELKLRGARVVGVFVATKLNLATWRATAELAVALGLDGVMFNRFNPGGRGRDNIALLQASPAELQSALDEAERISEQYDLPISCSIAMPPCLFDTGRYKRLTFGFCAAGTERAYYTLDPLGNVRPCNHSPTILGNILSSGFSDLARSGKARSFNEARPAFCAGCELEMQCQGGCKAAAEACCGSLWDMDPYLGAFQACAVKPARGKPKHATPSGGDS
jgi:radical SAM protein with 4Fe4S-binding SPASM domain